MVIGTHTASCIRKEIKHTRCSEEKKPNTLDAVKKIVKTQEQERSREKVHNGAESFQRRVEECSKAKGGRSEGKTRKVKMHSSCFYSMQLHQEKIFWFCSHIHVKKTKFLANCAYDYFYNFWLPSFKTVFVELQNKQKIPYRFAL